MSKKSAVRALIGGVCGAALVAIGLVATGNAQSRVPSAVQAVTPERVASETRTCQLDTTSQCTITHGFGETPKTIDIQEYGAGQAATLVDGSKTATSYRLRWLWHTGAGFTTRPVVKFDAQYTFAALPPATTPPASTPPVTSPPVSTPPASTPPTTPPDPGESPVKACAPSSSGGSGQTIAEGAGRSFFTGSGASEDEYFVHNNNWNDSYGGTHTIVACGHDNWYVDVNVPNHSDNAVEAYPNVHTDYNDVALSGIESARFAHNAERVSGMVWNAAFDIWIGQDFNNELMIWTENHGQRPAGTRLADTTLGGKLYEVWKSGGTTSPGGIFTYVSVTPQRFGTMPLQAFFTDVANRGWINGAPTTWQVDYGVETVDTNGAPWRFSVTDFLINDNY